MERDQHRMTTPGHASGWCAISVGLHRALLPGILRHPCPDCRHRNRARPALFAPCRRTSQPAAWWALRHCTAHWIVSSPRSAPQGVVTAAVLLDGEAAPGRHLRVVLLVLHGGVNSAWSCQDLISLTWPSKWWVGLLPADRRPIAPRALWIGPALLCWWHTADGCCSIGPRSVRSSASFRLIRIWPVPQHGDGLILVGLLHQAGLVCVRSVDARAPIAEVRQRRSPPCFSGVVC